MRLHVKTCHVISVEYLNHLKMVSVLAEKRFRKPEAGGTH